MPELRIEAIVNGRKVARDAKPWQRLLDFLRDDLGFTGTKEGCGAGECGTCSVFVDGVLLKPTSAPGLTNFREIRLSSHDCHNCAGGQNAVASLDGGSALPPLECDGRVGFHHDPDEE